LDPYNGLQPGSRRAEDLISLSQLGRYTAASLAGLTLLAGAGTVLANTAFADDTTAVGVGAGVYVDEFELDALIVQEIELALLADGRVQEASVFVTVTRGTVILSGFVTPAIHRAVLEVVAGVVGGIPLALPTGFLLGIPTGLPLPDLGVALDVILPDLTAALGNLGVIDRIVSS
jgi:hypothetical protein